MGSSPKAPKPTESEKQLQARQREEMAKLDDEENVRFKRALRGTLGSRRLLGGVARAPSSTASESAAIGMANNTLTGGIKSGGTTSGRIEAGRAAIRQKKGR